MNIKDIPYNQDQKIGLEIVGKVVKLNIKSFDIQDDSGVATLHVSNFNIEEIRVGSCYSFLYLEIYNGKIWVRIKDKFCLREIFN